MIQKKQKNEGFLLTSMMFKVADRAGMDSQIEKTVRLLIDSALVRGSGGILVTRHSPDEITAELDERVPFGVTYERQEW